MNGVEAGEKRIDIFLLTWQTDSRPMDVFHYLLRHGFPDSSVGKESNCNVGDASLTPGSGRPPGEGIGYPFQYSWASLVAQLVKNLPAMRETWVGKIPWRRERLPTPVFWSGEFHGLHSSWGGKELDTNECFSLSLLRHDKPPQNLCPKTTLLVCLGVG